MDKRILCEAREAYEDGKSVESIAVSTGIPATTIKRTAKREKWIRPPDGVKQIDLERIERDYRAGILTVNELCLANGIDKNSFYRLRAKHGWARDIRHIARDKALERLALPDGEDPVAASAVESSVLTIEAVVRRHRGRIAALSQFVDDGIAAIKAEVSLPGFLFDKEAAERLKTLVQTNSALIKDERQAYGLDEKSAEMSDPLADALKVVGVHIVEGEFRIDDDGAR